MRVCARVLAAALMTGAIAGAFALPSLVGQGVEEPRARPAPPSVKQRTLHLPVLKAPVEHTIAVRRHVAHLAARPALIAVRIAPAKNVHHRTVFHAAASAGRSGLPSRSPAPNPPAPKPTPAAPAATPGSAAPSTPPERALASTAQPATPVPPVAPPAKSGDDDHGNGHAYGQGQDNGNAQGNGNGQGNGNNGKGNGHKK
jgi:hypothetical protein